MAPRISITGIIDQLGRSKDLMERRLARHLGTYLREMLRDIMGRLDPDEIQDLPMEFWETKARELMDYMIPQMQEMAEEGAENFVDSVPLDLDYTLYSESVRNWATTEGGEWANSLTDVRRQALGEQLEKFITTPGYTLGDVQAGLTGTDLFSADRAVRIARTEVTRAYAQGQLQSGILLSEQYPDVLVIKTWHTKFDDKVCEVCLPLNGLSMHIRSDFSTDLGMMDGPPGHPNCRCWLTQRTDILANIPSMEDEVPF